MEYIVFRVASAGYLHGAHRALVDLLNCADPDFCPDSLPCVLRPWFLDSVSRLLECEPATVFLEYEPATAKCARWYVRIRLRAGNVSDYARLRPGAHGDAAAYVLEPASLNSLER